MQKTDPGDVDIGTTSANSTTAALELYEIRSCLHCQYFQYIFVIQIKIKIVYQVFSFRIIPYLSRKKLLR